MLIFNRHRIILSIAIFLTAMAACSGQQRFETQEFTIEGSAGNVIITAEIARTDAQKAQGLMHRQELNDGHGMLFVFDRDQILSFWMKDTLIPLSIAFIASDGRILEIRDMEPLDLTTVRSSRSARYALEVPKGWFDRAGLSAGDRLNLTHFR